MKRIPKFVWVLAVLAALWGGLKIWWDVSYPSGTWRYKMTVTVETPEGIKTGSAVREASIYSEPSIIPQQGGTFYNITKGEAVVIDLGQRGALFVLLGGQGEAANLFSHFPNKEKGVVTPLTLAQYPRFVRFRDINDPKTVENLLEVAVCKRKASDGNCIEDETGAIMTTQRANNSYIKKDRFAEAFGAGVKLKSVTIEMTDEPVTWGVAEKYMPSYRPIEDYMKWVNTLKYSDPRRIGPDSFRKGK